MYTPSSFKEENTSVLFELIRNYNFGVLFSQHQQEPDATHLPFLIDTTKGEKGTLIAHFAKANKHWKKLDTNKDVLCVFQGPHTYVSPSWYKNRETVPTWNYATVHASGKPKLIHEPEELREMVTKLTYYHENQLSSDWSLEESAPVFEIELKAIVGLEIEITKLEGKFKFNQNRSKEDQEGVIAHLDENNAPGVKAIMQQNLQCPRS